MADWVKDAVFYHLFPLGATGAEPVNDFTMAPARRLAGLHGWFPHWRALGINALLLGPVFESSSHGYDTRDLFTVDRRLGTNDDLAAFVRAAHDHGIRVVLDAVYNHVGREHHAFRDLRERREASPYRGWFRGLVFDGQSPYGDPFRYEGWSGHYSLVKLDTDCPEVETHLLEATRFWMDGLGVDGLRLDAADALAPAFMKKLHAFCKAKNPDFWLMGEVVHGDYTNWANAESLDSTTNYECYKGLWSAHNDRNYFEIAWSLERQFGAGGAYRGLPLYAFVDNHDVTRLASVLKDPAHQYPVYCLLFTMPGVPSVYYGSEVGWRGEKAPRSDAPLRPAIDPARLMLDAPDPELGEAVKRLIALRASCPALRRGSYRQLHVDAETLVFLREAAGQRMLVAVSMAREPRTLRLRLDGFGDTTLVDALNGDAPVQVRGGLLELDLHPCWARAYVG